MSSKIFKISAVAATVAASFAANAALYNVYLDAPEGASTSIQTYGVAVTEDSTDCWTATSCDNNTATSKMATEVKRYREGFSYRDESAFFLPYGWDYLDENYDGFKRYCRNLLGYTNTLCEKWADAQYTQGYAKEQAGNYAGSIAYLDGTQLSFSENTVVNSINASGEPVGNVRDGSTYRNVGYVNGTKTAAFGSQFLASHYWVNKNLTAGDFIVGSVTRNSIDTGNTNTYTSKPTIWKAGTPTEINWQGNRAENSTYKAQGSVRDIIEDSATPTTLYAVGYTSDGETRLKAAVFKSTDSGSTWSTGTLVKEFTYGESEYANQTLKAVNDNKIAIGTAKLNRPSNGAYANGLFYVDNLDNPAPKAFSGSMFFEGANGLAGNINNYNDVVGTIDLEQHSETNGKPRAQRAFITNLGAVTGSAPIGGQARYLDDLTNGSNATENNNQFRIIQAADINDAGVIAATAYYCAGGYSSDAIDASCSTDASLVGVKLVPIQGASPSDISPRPVTQTTIERQGGTLGFLALTLLGLLGFRRK